MGNLCMSTTRCSQFILNFTHKIVEFLSSRPEIIKIKLTNLSPWRTSLAYTHIHIAWRAVYCYRMTVKPCTDIFLRSHYAINVKVVRGRHFWHDVDTPPFRVKCVKLSCMQNGVDLGRAEFIYSIHTHTRARTHSSHILSKNCTYGKCTTELNRLTTRHCRVCTLHVYMEIYVLMWNLITVFYVEMYMCSRVHDTINSNANHTL